MTLGHLNRHILKSFEKIFQNFAERHQIDVRRGMPSFSSIPVTPRMLFKNNRGGGAAPTPPGGRGLANTELKQQNMSLGKNYLING